MCNIEGGWEKGRGGDAGGRDLNLGRPRPPLSCLVWGCLYRIFSQRHEEGLPMGCQPSGEGRVSGWAL